MVVFASFEVINCFFGGMFVLVDSDEVKDNDWMKGKLTDKAISVSVSVLPIPFCDFSQLPSLKLT